jgi:hypothetical protein
MDGDRILPIITNNRNNIKTNDFNIFIYPGHGLRLLIKTNNFNIFIYPGNGLRWLIKTCKVFNICG